MNNVIFGSGIVGLMAKSLLPSWTIIPFARSRFFAFNPALADNFIISSPDTDGFISDLSGAPVSTLSYKRAFDIDGYLYNKYDRSVADSWFGKIFGAQVPSQSGPYFDGRLDLSIYNLRVNKLYESLLLRNLDDLKAQHAKGVVTEIGDHYFIRNGVKEEFDNAISTVPLPAMCKLMRVERDLAGKTVHFLHVHTNSLDFEGHNQTFVVSPKFSFYKVTNIAPKRYLFYCHEEIQHPGQYLMVLLKDFDIIDGTSITDYLPMGPAPKLDWFEQRGVFCVGSCAQWDWCMDVGSCALRLIRYAQRGFKPFKARTI